MKARQESVGVRVSLGAGWLDVLLGTTRVYLALGRVYLCCRWHAQPTCPLNNVSLCVAVITSVLLLMTSLPFPTNFATTSPVVFGRSFPSSALFPYDGFWILWCPSSLLTPLFIILNLSTRGLAKENFPHSLLSIHLPNRSDLHWRLLSHEEFNRCVSRWTTQVAFWHLPCRLTQT